MSDASQPTGDQGAPQLPQSAERLNVHPFPIVLTGTILFALAFVGMLPFWSTLSDHGHRDWIWTALAGAVLGAMSLPLMRKHRDEGRLD